MTTAAEWRRKARACWLLTLPSGAVVKCRRPDFGRLVGDGVLTADDLVQPREAGPRDTYNRIVPMARAAAPHIAVEPRLRPAAAAADDGSVSADEVPETDVVAMFLWAGSWSTATPAVECPD